jgi:hypothetical protein
MQDMHVRDKNFIQSSLRDLPTYEWKEVDDGIT